MNNSARDQDVWMDGFGVQALGFSGRLHEPEFGAWSL